jgi:protein phosphatase
MRLVDEGHAYCLRGNHDAYLMRKLQGGDILAEFGLANEAAVLGSLAQVESRGRHYGSAIAAFLAGLPAHLVLDEGRLVVAHAGLPQALHGADTAEARDFAVFGPRANWEAAYEVKPGSWQAAYGGEALVVYGHYAGPRCAGSTTPSAWIRAASTEAVSLRCVIPSLT